MLARFSLYGLYGWLLQRWAGVDATTGFLGSLPGTAASSVALASDLKADPFMVVILMLGMSVGAKFDLVRLRASWKPALVQVALVLGLLVACLGAAYVFHRLTDADWLTAVLCTTPGGKESMVAFSIEIGGNVELVMFLGPALVVWMTRKQRMAAAAMCRPV